MTDFGNLPPAPPPPPDELRRARRSGTPYSRALGATAVWNVLPAGLVVTSLIRGVEPPSEAASDLIIDALVATFLGALIVWLIAKRRQWRLIWLILLALPFYVILLAFTDYQVSRTYPS